MVPQNVMRLMFACTLMLSNISKLLILCTLSACENFIFYSIIKGVFMVHHGFNVVNVIGRCNNVASYIKH